MRPPDSIIVLMFPILVTVYWRLAQREEDARAEFGTTYEDYRTRTPAPPFQHLIRPENLHEPS